MSTYSQPNIQPKARIFSRDSPTLDLRNLSPVSSPLHTSDHLENAEDPKSYVYLSDLNIRASRPYVMAMFLVVIIYVLIGVAVYRDTSTGWTFLEAVYFSVVTLATVGYGDFVPVSEEDRIFTCFFVIIGFCACVTLFAFLRLYLAASGDKDEKRKSLETMHMIEKALQRANQQRATDTTQSSTSKHFDWLRNDTSIEDSNIFYQYFISFVKSAYRLISSFIHRFDKAFEPPLDDETLQAIREVYQATYRQEYIAIWKRTLHSALVIFSIAFVGSLCMSYIESWTGVNSAYWAVITIMTIGYGDVVPTTSGGRVFTIFYILIGCTYVGNAIQELATAPIYLRSKYNELEVLKQFTGKLSKQKLEHIFECEFFENIPRLRRTGDEISKSEFCLLILYLMSRVDGKDIYVASQIFEHIDRQRKGYLSSQEIQQSVDEAEDEPEPPQRRQTVPETIINSIGEAVQKVENFASSGLRRTLSMDDARRRSNSLDSRDKSDSLNASVRSIQSRNHLFSGLSRMRRGEAVSPKNLTKVSTKTIYKSTVSPINAKKLNEPLLDSDEKA